MKEFMIRVNYNVYPMFAFIILVTLFFVDITFCSSLSTLLFVRTKENVDESLKKRKEKKRRKKGFKSHIAQDKHLNSVSLPIYRELISSFFLVPVEKHFLNFSFSLPYFSRCIFGKLLPFSFCHSKIMVGYNSDFLSHIFGWL